MTESDIIQNNFGNNAYAQHAAGLVMLREQILGPETFDDAFRTYSKKWAFKHPSRPIFRSIEGGENLAWYWRGWDYATYANDQTIANVSKQIKTWSGSSSIRMKRTPISTGKTTSGMQ